MTDHSQDYVTKRTLIMCSMIVGVALALVLVACAIGGYLILDYRSDEIAHNRDRASHEAAVNRKQAELIRDLRALTHPTPAQADRQLREGIRRCLSRPLCRRLFPGLRARSSSRDRADRRRASDRPGAGATATPTVETPERRGSAHEPSRPSRPERTTPAPKRPASPSRPSAGGTSSTPPPPRPQHTIDVTVPLPVQVCTDRILGINCSG